MPNQEYNVQIFGKNIDVTNSIRNYVLEKVHKIERLTDNIMEVVVRLEVQRLEHSVSITMKFAHFKITIHAKTVEMYSAIDRAFVKLGNKLRKWKERIQDHHAKKIAAVDMRVNVLGTPKDETADFNEEIEEENLKNLEKVFFSPKTVKTKTRPLKMLTLEEAIMKMELSGDNFMLFKCEEDQDLKVIYRRRDGGLGVIISEAR